MNIEKKSMSLKKDKKRLGDKNNKKKKQEKQ